MNLGGNYSAAGGADLSDATTIELLSVYGAAGSTGELDTVGFGDLGTVNPGSISLTSFVSTDVLDIEGWSLELTSLNIQEQTTSNIKLFGNGIVSGNGFDATPSSWTFTTTAGSSYSMSVTAVPVPAAVWLFGSGLIGLVGIARRKS